METNFCSMSESSITLCALKVLKEILKIVMVNGQAIKKAKYSSAKNNGYMYIMTFELDCTICKLKVVYDFTVYTDRSLFLCYKT